MKRGNEMMMRSAVYLYALVWLNYFFRFPSLPFLFLIYYLPLAFLFLISPLSLQFLPPLSFILVPRFSFLVPRSSFYAPLYAVKLCAVHKAGWMHRDVSPANVLIDDGAGKLCDFGLSKPISRGKTLNDSNGGIGEIGIEEVPEIPEIPEIGEVEEIEEEEGEGEGVEGEGGGR
jgi:serine/threonine protein kinase